MKLVDNGRYCSRDDGAVETHKPNGNAHRHNGEQQAHAVGIFIARIATGGMFQNLFFRSIIMRLALKH